MPKISNVFAREILDSRGKPTVEATVSIEEGTSGTASVPSGASTGGAEAFELRDGDAARYDGQGVLQAVKNVNLVIGPALIGKSVVDQQDTDGVLRFLDSSSNKRNLGANALLAVSLAASRTAALYKRVSLFRHIHDSLLERAGSNAGSFRFAPQIPVPIDRKSVV